MKALRVEGLAKRYPGFTLGPVDFELEAGKAYGLLGPNGAGKTTLLGSLAGHLHHDGDVSWAGEPVVSSNWRLREKIAYVPETPNLYGNLTVAQTLRFCSIGVVKSLSSGRRS
jgi:ABC-2 type transport system ATP-binding protein